jgi:hypothetical protein
MPEIFAFDIPWLQVAYDCKMALYVLAEQVPPIWYQLDCAVPAHSYVLPMLPPGSLHIAVRKPHDVRPVVAWDGL